MAEINDEFLPPQLASSTVTILLSRNATSAGGNTGQDTSTAKLAIVARLPHKRSGLDDPIRHTLQYFTFLDDRSNFAHVDALLTRLAPVADVYVGCTENIEGDGDGSNSSGVGNKRGAKKAAAEASALIHKLVNLIKSRTDISDPTHGNASNVNIQRYLPKSKANTIAESSLRHLLGGETSEAHLAYRGDKRLTEEPMITWCLGHLFAADNSICDESDDTLGSHRVIGGTLTSHLSLDRTAAEAIHLLPPRNNSGAALLTGGNSSNNSLFGVLNHCKTKMGSRTLEVWLRQPLVDLEMIVRRQNAVAKFVENSIELEKLREEGLGAFRGMDLDGLGYRLSAAGRAGKDGGGRLGCSTSKALESLYKLYLLGDKCLPPLLEAMEGLIGESEEEGEEASSLRASFVALQLTYQELEKAVQLAEHVLDLNAAPRDFLVNPSLDENLVEVKNELDAIQEELEALHAEMNDTWAEVSGQGGNQVRLEDVDNNANTTCVWQFRLPKTNDAKLLEERLVDQGVQIHRILKNGVYFSTKELVQLGVKKKDLMMEYEEKQSDLVIKAMAVASTFVPVLERASATLAELDVLASLAYVAAFSRNGYCRPLMTDGEEDGLGIELKEARHPCVELQDNMNFIPNDMNLVFGESSFQICTGPNSGGKSTYIRGLGAIITMAQIGSFVPCTSAKINIIHHILARVGAGDCQDRGISTFMAEMLEASSILRTATKRSLIIIDELGRGTSTFGGYGLAKAISEHIIQKIGCITVFATHFHELTVLEEQESSVANCHVTAHSDRQNGLTFLYQVRPGPCLQSFGIQVAEMANMPNSIIVDAKRKAKQLENFDYRKKSKTVAESDGLEASEKTATAMEFLHKFRKLPFKKMSEKEKHEALLSLTMQYGLKPLG
mmetsp:Transcript_1084/g.2237  ORF Transcript_1084/g.2237 Transcript_1084/m.2237 type:complete len:895 (-) Transcript_1084:119-2803(-)